MTVALLLPAGKIIFKLYAFIDKVQLRNRLYLAIILKVWKQDLSFKYEVDGGKTLGSVS